MRPAYSSGWDARTSSRLARSCESSWSAARMSCESIVPNELVSWEMRRSSERISASPTTNSTFLASSQELVDEKALELRMSGASGQARVATATASAAGVFSGVARMAHAMASCRASAQLNVAILSA